METASCRILVIPWNLHPMAFPAQPRIAIKYFHWQPGSVDPFVYICFAYPRSPSEHPIQANKHLEIHGDCVIIFIHW